jgi:cell division septation protein DedD
VDRPIRTHADTAGSETPPPLVGGARLSDEEFDRIRLPTDGASRAALIADLRERQRTARLAGEAGELSGARTVPSDTGADRLEPPAVPLVVPSSGGAVTRELEMEARADDVELEAITPPGRTSARRTPDGYRRPLIWTLAVVLLVSALAGAWRYLSGRLPRASEVVAAPEPVPEPTGPTYADDALPYVVAIEAHRDLPTAVERVTDLREIEPELAFHIEPLERDGVVFYHVMAGPVPDSTLALALRDTLIARGHKTGRTPTDVRATPFTYLVGEYSTEDDAQEQSDILRRLDIPGYVLRAAAADGEPVFRLYVGGFGSEAEAGAIGQMLRAAGIRDTLVTRTGAMSYGALLSAPDATDRDSTATDSITP